VTRLTFILEPLRVQADIWVITIHIVEPYSVMDNQPRLLATYLAQPTIYGQPIVYISLPDTLPWSALVELFLIHSTHSNGKKTRPFDPVLDDTILPQIYCHGLPAFRVGGTSGTKGTRFSINP
jgi:hypothetical protein